MTPKRITPSKKREAKLPPTWRYSPFTRLDHSNPATIVEFDREELGIAAKE